MAFKAFLDSSKKRNLVVVDLGYSAHNRSCGIYWTGATEPEELEFGGATKRTAEMIGKLEDPVLVLEAVLSTYHDSRSGNPDIRGDFEQGRGWYYGAGVLSFAAALRFLHELDRLGARDISIAEAFLSFKDTPTGHGKDAKAIHDQFWSIQVAILRRGVEPASPLVPHAPSVRVFKPQP
jgi:hypothetical protein